MINLTVDMAIGYLKNKRQRAVDMTCKSRQDITNPSNF